MDVGEVVTAPKDVLCGEGVPLPCPCVGAGITVLVDEVSIVPDSVPYG